MLQNIHLTVLQSSSEAAYLLFNVKLSQCIFGSKFLVKVELYVSAHTFYHKINNYDCSPSFCEVTIDNPQP